MTDEIRDPWTGMGAAQFRARGGELFCEELSVCGLAERFGSPLFVYSRAAIEERFRRLEAAFGPDAVIAYAVKSNPNLTLLRLLDGWGSGFDLVSLGELRRLQAAGARTDHAVFAGVAKEPAEIEAGLDAGILLFNVESPHELDLFEDVGASRARRVPVALRLNPDVESATHAYIATGRRGHKFGIDLAAAADVVARVAASENLRLVGYHVHLGSQLRAVQPYLDAFDRIAEFMDGAAARRDGVRYYDMGGGFGVGYGQGEALDVGELARQMLPRLAERALLPVLEPGRYLVAEAGVLVTKVLGIKDSGERRFVLVDAAMTELIRPALYQAWHPVAPVRWDGSPGDRRCDVVGPVCETGDFLARDRDLPDVQRGDRLAVFGAGAYGSSMASNYNARRRPAEVLVDGDRATLIRRRETFEDLWAAELTGDR